ncbi:GNAT family N-acetyltransferase [Pseudomonas fragi]|uniref:GNAT family N-acetyltransferase n=1 Tax=Pseudomonas fragi TaxID=296 RepID=UPI000BA25386|nr:GNAT family N-acetyltransferase [Pseudomonas fragi]PAA26231.1 GNAT family N-acetyltransferase [Pseudomonas fragi]
MKNLAIRNASLSDATQLCAAERETARTPGLLVSRPDEFTAQAFERKILALNDQGLYLVAELNGQIVGHALLEPLGLEALAHIMNLTIVVHPGHVGQGIGHQLMAQLLEWAGARQGLVKIELRVRELNHHARHLYQKFGFVEEGRLQKRIRLPDGTLVADISMAWFVSDYS